MKSKKSKLFKGFYKLLGRLPWKNTNRTWIILAIVLILSVALFIGLATTHRIHPASQTATLILSLKDKERTFQGEVLPHMTVLDALIASAKAGQIHFLYFIDNQNNTEITELYENKIEADTDIEIYLNSEKIKVTDLNRIIVNIGDVIRLKLDD